MTVIATDTGTPMIGMKADMAPGGVLPGDIRTALIPLLHGIVIRGHTRDPLGITPEPAITHTHQEADLVDTPPVTLAMTHAADLPRLVDTRRTLADRGALEVIPVAAADLKVGISPEITIRLSLLQDPADIMDHVLRLSFFHHPQVHLQGLIDHQLCSLLVVGVVLLEALLP